MDDAGQNLELALLAAPIPGDAPAGADLREDFSPQSPYYRLRDARAEARALERQADADPSDKNNDPSRQWRQVRDLALKALAERTKDLEIAAWLTESLVRNQNQELAGLAAGARLIADLVEGFWDSGLFPLPDEDGIATRVSPITGLNGQGSDGTLMQPLRKLPLFAMEDGRPVSLWEYGRARELEAMSEEARGKQRATTDAPSYDDVSRAAGRAGSAHFATLRATVKETLDAWTLMDERLTGRLGADAPPTTRVRDLLLSVLEIANRYAPRESAADEASHDDAAQVGSNDEQAVDRGQPAAKHIVTRDGMLRELERIAEYFRRTEPHSPLAYTLEEAVRRGRLTWPELLQEVVPDGTVRSTILLALGIRPPQE